MMKLKKGKLFNAAGVIYQGSIQHEYFKQELPNYNVFDEKRYFSPGKGPCLFKVKDKHIALTICEDIWHPNGPIKKQSEQGANLIINIKKENFY